MIRANSPRLAALAVALAACWGCSSSSSTASTSSTSSAPSTSSAESPTTAAAPTTAPGPTTPTTAVPGASRAVPGGAPSVANAKDLNVAPVISPGGPNPPDRLVQLELVFGTGAVAQRTSTVTVQYVGANYVDGKVFDSSWTRGQPASFPLSGVIPGFAQGLLGMRIGGRKEIVIPPSLGYGPQGSGPVGPNETLVFVVDLLAVQ